MSDEQAEKLADALDVFVRLRSGDIMAMWFVPTGASHDSTRADLIAALKALSSGIEALKGVPREE